MNKIFLLVTIVIITSFMSADTEETDKITGSGVVMMEARLDSNYLALDSSIAFDNVIVHCGSGYSMTIMGDDNIVPLIVTKVKGNVLHISSEYEFETKAESVLSIHVQTL